MRNILFQILATSLVGASMAMAAPSVTTLSPANGASVGTFTTLSVTFNEAVTGLDASDLSINNESPISVTGSGAGPYVFTFSQPPAGAVGVSWEVDHGIAGVGTGPFAPTGGYSYTLNDTIAPTLGKVTPAAGSTLGVLTEVEVAFSEMITGLDAGDLLVNGTPAVGLVAKPEGTFVFTIVEPPVGAVNFSWAGGHGISDSAGNAFTPAGWSVTRSATGSGTVVINEILALNGLGITDEDLDQNDWIELRNTGAASVNLAGWSLTNDAAEPRKWVFPSRTIASGAYLVVFASGKDRTPTTGNLHTNFKLNENGESLILNPPDSPAPAASSAYNPFPVQRTDYSYGLGTGGAYFYFTTPTPNAANAAGTLTAIASRPTASVTRGFFKDPFTVVLSCATPGATIRYTLNGSVPTAGSTAYTTPISVSNTTVLRAAAFATNFVPSETVTHSYIYLDSTFSQKSPPYDAVNLPPSVGGVALPTTWGTSNQFTTANVPLAGYVNNTVPADYGMDPKIVNDPNKYDDSGAINPAGKTNLERMQSALRELPILSLVLPSGDMWGPTANALYPTSSASDKTDRTKPCSLEMILPDGSTAFAVTCGVDLHGNASRDSFKNPKHGFTLKFKGDYGPGNLDYPVFTDSPVQKHDKLVLRADFNYSWRHQDNLAQRPFGNRIRDAWTKDTFRDMGRTAGHHRYVNLFINGVYWGSYDLAEDQGDNFGADYFGGDKADYDVIEQGILKSGTITAYNAMTAIASPIDNTKYEQMKTYLDLPNFIDYMMLHFYVGHTDWGDNVNKNWYAIRNWRKNGTYKFLPWDMENLLAGETVDRTGVTAPAGGLHPKLVTNSQYLLDFADRVHRQMVSPDGPLLPTANIARLNKWASIMNAGQQALESARWGDYRRDVHRYTAAATVVYTWNGKWFESSTTQTSTTSWLAEQSRLTNTYFPVRTTNVLGQLRTRSLYPLTNAPEIRDNGTNLAIASRRVSPGFVVKFANVVSLPSGTSNATTFYYTTNGTDPRVYYTGAVSPSAIAVAPNSTLTINATTTIKIRGLNGAAWSALNEQTFTVGTEALIPPVRITEIMYNPPGNTNDDAKEFVELKNFGAADVDISNWYFEGINCIIPQGTVIGPGDHFVVANNNLPAVFATTYPGVAVGAYFGGSIDNGGERIALYDKTGRTIQSVDFTDNPPWPIAADGGGSSLEIVNADGDPDDAANWKASAATNGSPGSTNSTASGGGVIISEFFVQNNGAYTYSGAQPGFVELQNTGATAVVLNAAAIRVDGVDRAIIPNGTQIPASGFLTVHFHNTPLPGISGVPSLSTARGVLEYRVGAATVDSVRYGPQAPNFSFGKVAGTWTLCAPSAGAANSATATAVQTNLRINEWLPNPRPGMDDWAEFYNSHATLPAVLGGMYVATGSQVFQYKTLAAIPPLGWARLYCNAGSSRADAIDFNLPATGTTLTIRDAAGTEIDAVTFNALNEDVSQGRLPDGSATIVALGAPSPAAPNHAALVNQPQINELVVTNLTGENSPWAKRPGWLELRNPTGGVVSLAGWKLRAFDGSAEWTIPSGVSLPALGHLAIWNDSAQASSLTNVVHLNAGVPLLSTGRVELLNAAGQLVDVVNFGRQIADSSIGRTAGGTWALLTSPTRGTLNNGAASLGVSTALRVNEWSTGGLELYNTGALPVALEGLYFSDDPSELGRRKFAFPPLSFIAGNGWSFFTSLDTGFTVSAGGEYARLALANDSVIDAVSFGSAAGGRQPDGSATIGTIAATPGLANISGPGPWFTAIAPPVVTTAGSSITLTVGTINATGHQWYRNGSLIPGAILQSLTIPAAATADDGVYTVVATGPGGSATSAAMLLTVLHTYATWIAGYGSAGAPANGDLDGDGISNLAEFMANTSPVVAAAVAERTAAHVKGGLELSSGLPANLTLDFRINRRAGFTGITPQFTDTLGAWQTATPSLMELLSTEANGDQNWRMKFSLPPGTQKRFIRLSIAE
jgi:hypothetical protein